MKMDLMGKKSANGKTKTLLLKLEHARHGRVYGKSGLFVPLEINVNSKPS